MADFDALARQMRDEQQGLLSQTPLGATDPVAPEPSNIPEPRKSLSFDDFAAEMKAERDPNNLDVVIPSVANRNPEVEAEARRLGTQVGLPQDVAARSIDRVREIVDGMNPPSARLDGAPRTAAWLSNPDNAALARDDLDRLAILETSVLGGYEGARKKAWEALTPQIGNIAAGIGETAFGIVGGLTRFTATLADAGADWADANLGVIEYDFTSGMPSLSWRRATPEEVARPSPLLQFAKDFENVDLGYVPGTTWEDVKASPLSTFIPFALEQGIISIPHMAASLGNLPGYMAARTGQIGQERAGNDGRQEATVEDLMKAAPAAIASAALERLATKGILGITDDVAAPTVGGVLAATGRGAVLEGTTEGVQEGIEYAGATLGTEAGFDPAQAGENMLAGALTGAVFGGAVRSGTATFEAVQMQRAAERARMHHDRTMAIINAAKESALRTRSPEAFEEYFQSVVEASPNEEVLVSPRPVIELLQAAGEDPVTFFDSLGVSAETLARAAAQGHDISVNSAKLAARLPDSPYANDVIMNLREDPRAMTMLEAEVQSQAFKDQADKIAAERGQGVADAAIKNAQEVRDLATKMARDAGYTGSQARAVGELLASPALTFAADFAAEGKEFDPLQFMTDLGLVVRDERQAAAPGVETGMVAPEAAPAEVAGAAAAPSSAAPTALATPDVPDVPGDVGLFKPQTRDTWPVARRIQEVAEAARTASELAALADPNPVGPQGSVTLRGGRQVATPQEARELAERHQNYVGTVMSEMVDAINADADLQARGISAEAKNGGVYVRGLEDGRAVSFGAGNIAELTDRLGLGLDQTQDPGTLNQTPFDAEAGGTTPHTADTIVVNGVERPTVNSTGRPIAATKEGLENFWNWFGSSQVVDAKGRPLVVYHGTPDGRALNAEGGAFDKIEGFSFISDPARFAALGEEIAKVKHGSDEYFALLNERSALWQRDTRFRPSFFTNDRRVANTYADARRAFDYQNAEPDTLLVYLSIQNPTVIDARGRSWGQRGGPSSQEDQIQAAMAAGHDGIVIRNTLDTYNVDGNIRSDVYVAFNPAQIKSINNRGTFDGNDPRILFQTASLRRGTETLKKFGLDPDGRYTTRKVATALEARQRQKYGTIERGDYSDKASRRIADWMVEEVMFEVEQAEVNPMRSAVGWYSTKYQSALDAFGAAFPELIGEMDGSLPGVALLGTRQNARDFFTALMAITSDGAKVADNFRFATQAYEFFRQNGQINVDVTFGGERNKSMRVNLQNVQDLLNEVGADRLTELLLQKDTVSNLKKVAKEQGREFSTAYKANMELPYSALIFGPKLGAFYANLMGDTGYLTMDRWWSRTFNRYRGTLLQQPTEAGLARFKELVTADQRRNTPADQMTDDEALALTVDYVRSYKAKAYKNGTEIEKAANTLYKAAFEGLEDQPFNASDREFMINATVRAQRSLKRKGVDLTIADVQAVLWYYEKRLYGELGARQTQDISYEEIARAVVAGRDPAAGPDDDVDGGAADAEGLDVVADQQAPGRDGPVLDAVEEQFGEGAGDLTSEFEQSAAPRSGVIDFIRDNPGGFTVDLDTGTAPATGFVVAPLKQAELVLDPAALDEAALDRLVDLVMRVQESTGRKTFAGGWLNADDGMLYLDASQVFETEDEAVYAALAGEQLAYFDIGASNVIGTPDGVQRLRERGVYSDERLRDARASEREASSRFDGRGLRDQAEGVQLDQDTAPRLNLDNVRELQQAAFHGSPHIFERFALDAIGTGEGAQAYGWGLYFSSSKAVAEHYRRALSDTRSVPGAVAALEDMLANPEDYNYGFRSGFTAFDIKERLSADGYAATVTRLASGAFVVDLENRTIPGQIVGELLVTKDAVEVVKDQSGRLYTVNLAPADDAYLLWDKPLSEQGEVGQKVRDLVKQLETPTPEQSAADASLLEELGAESIDLTGVPDPRDNLDGAGAYRLLSELFRAKAYNEGADLSREVFQSGGEWTPEFRARDAEIRRRMDNADRAASEALAAAGIPGIKYLDGASRSEGEGSFNYVIFDDKLIEIVEFEQRQREARFAQDENRPSREPRGSIQFGPESVTINMFKNADLSTFLHESGHLFVFMLEKVAQRPDAPKRIRDNYAAMLEWVGATSAADLDLRINGDAARDKQEKLARAFEAYLREGKAPKAELVSAFARFKQWLLSIYKRMVDLDVEIDDRIRQVFDRMIATEEQLTQAEAINAFRPEGTPGITDLMSEDERARYLDLQARAHDQAAADLDLDRREAEMQETREEWVEQREKTRAEVENKTWARPEYRALWFLTRGSFRDGDTPPNMAGRKMSKADLLDRGFTQADLNALPRGQSRVYTTGENGMDADVLAAGLGFDSAAEMVEALRSMRPADEVIDAETALLMKSEFGDPLNDGTLERLAEERIYNDKRAEAILAELDALAKKTNTQKIGRPLIKAIVDRIFATEPVGALMTPVKYQSAAIRAARLAERALPQKDYPAAFRHKREQLLNHEMFRRALKARDEVAKINDKLKRRQTGKIDPNQVDPEYINQIKNILAAYNFGSQPSMPMREAAIAAAAAFVERKTTEDAAQIAAAARILDRANLKHWRDMTLEELRGLRDTVDSLYKAGRDNGKEAKARFDDEMAELGEGIRENHTPATATTEAFNRQNKRSRVGKIFRQFLAEHRKMESILRQLDGLKELGPMIRRVWQPLADAQGKKVELIERAMTGWQAALDLLPEKTRKTFGNPRYQRVIPETGYAWTTEERVVLALNWGNLSSRQAVLDDKYRKSRGPWDESVVEAVLKTLSKEELDFVESVWDLVNSYWPETAALEKEMTGVVPPKVEALPYLVNGREMKGGYYPLRYDPETSDKAQRDQTDDLAKQLMSGGWGRAATAHGHTKERVGSAGQAIQYSVGVVFSHLEQVTHDIAYRKAVREADRVLRHPEVQSAMRDTIGLELRKTLEEMLVLTAAGNQPPVGGYEKIMRSARINMTAAVMGLNLRSILTQPLGLTQSIARQGVRDTAAGILRVWGNPAGIRRKAKQAFEKSSFMRDRAKLLNREIAELRTTLEERGMKQRLQEFGFAPMVILDMYGVALPTWWGAYEAALAGRIEGVDAVEAEAVAYADGVVRQTQGAGGAQNLAGIQTRSELLKLVTLFYSYFNTTYQLMAEANTRRRNTSAAGKPIQANARFMVEGTMLMIIPAILGDLIMNAWPDDDEIEEEGPFWAWMKWSLLSVLNYSAATMVGVRDLVSGTTSGFGYTFTPVESIGKGIGTLVGDIAETVPELVDGEVDWTASETKNALRLYGYLAGIPGTGQLIRTGDYLFKAATDDLKNEPDNALEAIRGAILTGDR